MKSKQIKLQTIVPFLCMLLPFSDAISQSVENKQRAQHHVQMRKAVLNESGTDLFATVQEVIKKLEDNPNTDWSKVNLEALRQHLRDMFEFSYNVDVVSQQAIENGVKIRAKPLTDRARIALDNVLSAHPMMLKMETAGRCNQAKLVMNTT